jgi:hypothetical protein
MRTISVGKAINKTTKALHTLLKGKISILTNGKKSSKGMLSD